MTNRYRQNLHLRIPKNKSQCKFYHFVINSNGIKLQHTFQNNFCLLKQFLAERRQALTEAVEQLLELFFSAELKQRRLQHEEEMAELSRSADTNKV